MPFASPYVNTGATVITQDADNEAKVWQKGADKFDQTEDILKQFEGGADSIIQSVTETGAGRGHTVTFRAMAGLYGPGLQGESLFNGDRELLEEVRMSANSVKVDLLRNGIENFFMMEDALGMRGEIESELNEQMGAWMGRERSFQGLMSLIHQVDTGNHLFANDAGTLDGLAAGDLLAMDDITTAAAMIEPMGGTPARIGMDGSGNPIRGACFLSTTTGVLGLKRDNDWKQAQREAGNRGATNLLFQGGMSEIDGNFIKTWNVIDHDGFGAVGSPLNPKAFLGVAIVAGTTADMTGVTRTGIIGGGSAAAAAKTKIPYFRFFPKFAFPFLGASALSVTASTHFLASGDKFYVKIVNPPNAATDPNKWGIYRCTLNQMESGGNELTVDLRHAAAISGIAHTTVGNVVGWDPAVHTDVHPVGSLIVPCNASGVPYGRTLGLYKRAMRRARGAFTNKRMTDSREGGAVKELYIASIFGQKPRQNVTDKFPGVVVINHAATYPGWNA